MRQCQRGIARTVRRHAPPNFARGSLWGRLRRSKSIQDAKPYALAIICTAMHRAPPKSENDPPRSPTPSALRLGYALDGHDVERRRTLRAEQRCGRQKQRVRAPEAHQLRAVGRNKKYLAPASVHALDAPSPPRAAAGRAAAVHTHEPVAPA